MNWLSAIPAVIAAVGAAYQIYQGIEAAETAEDIAEENARRAEEEGARSASILKSQQDATMSLQRARAAASGVRSNVGSQFAFLEGQEEQAEGELNWLQKSTKSQANLARKQGGYTAKQVKSQALGTGLGTAMAGASSSAQWYSAIG